MKNRMFVRTSFAEVFWKDFGRGLGGQNPRFSHFFRNFFEANFGRRLGKAKDRKKERPPEVCRRFWVGPAECAEARGRDREGVNPDI